MIATLLIGRLSSRLRKAAASIPLTLLPRYSGSEDPYALQSVSILGAGSGPDRLDCIRIGTQIRLTELSCLCNPFIVI